MLRILFLALRCTRDNRVLVLGGRQGCQEEAPSVAEMAALSEMEEGVGAEPEEEEVVVVLERRPLEAAAFLDIR